MSAEDLAARFGTPLYAYSSQSILEKIRNINAAFRRRLPLICYAMKANSSRALCRLISGQDAGADIVSGGELWRALRAGFKPSRIIFSGVGKTQEEMAFAIRRGVLALNVESFEELEALRGVAKRMGKKAPVSIRLNPGLHPKTHTYIATGRSGDKFGLPEKEALALYGQAARWREIALKGVQCHTGSQIFEIETMRKAALAVRQLIEKLEERRIALEFADLGGGFGVPYEPKQKPFDLGGFAKTIEEIFAGRPNLRLIVEPGRYLVADAGILLTSVLYRKKNQEGRMLIVDAGMNDLLRPALYGAYHPVEAVKAAKKTTKETVDIAGPVCESADFLARRRLLPEQKPGDVLAVLKAGAYGYSMSSSYNSRKKPAEVLVGGSRCRLIRRRETWQDLAALER